MNAYVMNVMNAYVQHVNNETGNLLCQTLFFRSNKTFYKRIKPQITILEFGKYGVKLMF